MTSALTLPALIVAALAWAALMARVIAVAARMFQIEEYEAERFWQWSWNARWRGVPAVNVALVIWLLGIAGYFVLRPYGSAVPVYLGGIWLAASAAGHMLWRWSSAKKPLVFTARMRRLLAVAAVLLAAIAVLVSYLLATLNSDGLLVLMLVSQFTVTSTIVLLLANWLLQPVETRVRNHYLALARQKLQQIKPIVVAVVGSYGKTSTKHILAHLISPSAVTLPTRKSFNTLMGVCRVINEDLRDEHRVFIVEMDAYAPGEIAAISKLVHPQLAIITAVGPQHLERFKTVEKIADSLYEVVRSLPADGTFVVYGDDEMTAALGARAVSEQRRVVRYGTRANNDVIVDSSETTSTGSRFSWRWPSENLVHAVNIPLLGSHQMLNTAAGLAAVRVLGFDLDRAVTAAATLPPVEHRLQVMQSGGPVTVIDDSYNANPVGVHNGLDVLASFPGGQKILVTPGVVELGSKEAEENRRYGQHAAKACDHVIVVEGGPAGPLLAGLRSGGMLEERIHTVGSVAEATAVIGSITRAGDVVLFANDLPDTYIKKP